MNGSRHRIRHSGESRNPEGEGGTNHTQTLPPTNASNFHTLVCRRQPAWAIGTKACPGLRPGMDGSRHRIRHSGESRNPGGRVAPTTPKHFQRPGLIFIPWCAGASRHERLVRKHVPDSDPGWIPAPAGDTNHRRPNNDSRGPKERCSAGAGPLPAGSGGRPLSLRPPLRHSGEGRNPGEESAAATNFHTSVCRRQPARAIPMEPCPASTSDRLIATSTGILGLATAKSNPRGRIGRGRGPYQQIEGDESGPSRSPASAPS